MEGEERLAVSTWISEPASDTLNGCHSIAVQLVSLRCPLLLSPSIYSLVTLPHDHSSILVLLKMGPRSSLPKKPEGHF